VVAPQLAGAESNARPALGEDLRVRHREFETTRPYDEVIAAFENAVGSVENIGWPAIRSAAKDLPSSRHAFTRGSGRVGLSGF
jgi:hypothetical protein